MKKSRLRVATGAAVIGVLLAPQAVSAAAPGTPGSENCAGQTTAYLAQAAGPKGFGTAPGLGNLANFWRLDVQDIRTGIAFYCRTGISPL